jgi:hypothetical protein
MRESKLKTSAFLLVTLLLTLSSREAYSADPDPGGEPTADACVADSACRVHYRNARRFSKAGNLEAALKEYQAAYGLQPIPRLLFNIARTHHKLGQLPQAVENYDKYLAAPQKGDEETVAKAKQHREQAQREIQASSGNQQPAATPPAAVVAQPSEDQPVKQPVYKKWWFWTIIGVGTAVVLAGIIGGTVSAGSSGTSSSTLASQVPPGLPTYEVRF